MATGSRGWSLGSWDGGIPGGSRGVAGTPGSLARCPVPVPGCCTCPKPALAPQVPKTGRHGVSMHTHQIFPHSDSSHLGGGGREAWSLGPGWGGEDIHGLQFPRAPLLRPLGVPRVYREPAIPMNPRV